MLLHEYVFSESERHLLRLGKHLSTTSLHLHGLHVDF